MAPQRRVVIKKKQSPTFHLRPGPAPAELARPRRGLQAELHAGIARGKGRWQQEPEAFCTSGSSPAVGQLKAAVGRLAPEEKAEYYARQALLREQLQEYPTAITLVQHAVHTVRHRQTLARLQAYSQK